MARAYLKQEWANPVILSLVLYMAIPQPPSPGKSYTFIVLVSPPSAGVNLISKVPGPSTTKSVALY